MKFTKIIAAALALLCGSAMLPKATVGAEEVLLDSGIDYTESTWESGSRIQFWCCGQLQA